MKKTILPLFSFLIIILSACQKNVNNIPEESISAVPSGYSNCGSATETAILAGQHTNVGSITVWNDEANVYVQYEASGNYMFKKTHLYVGACNAIPVNNAGNPKIGNFPFNNNHGTPGVSSFIRTIPLSILPEGCLCVAAHAEVVAYNSSGGVIFSETGWGEGQQINAGGSWAMKFDYCIQSCQGNGEIR
jgi:hypothetical protein